MMPSRWPRLRPKLRSLKSGRSYALRELLDVEDDVAGAADLAEVHARRLDPGRPLDAFELVELLLPRLRLLVQLAVVDAADVLFLLLDVLLLRLPRLQLLLVAFLAQPPVGLVSCPGSCRCASACSSKTLVTTLSRK